mgnify:CR=1 FL=1
MKIFIMRHGEAADIAGDDSQRPLTKQGIDEAKTMGQWILQQTPNLVDVMVSPYIRAQQTCDYVLRSLSDGESLSHQVNTADFITPSGNAKQVHDFVDGVFSQDQDKNYSDENTAVLFISHMPFVSYFVAELTDKNNMPMFSTGAIAVIDYDLKSMQGQLVEIISPCQVIN